MRLKFLAFLLISTQVFCQKIHWNENQKLVWDNFKSTVNRRGGADVVAYTNCGIQYEVVKSSDPKVPVKLTIQAVFNEEKSWKDTKRITDYILVHEQKHFDIAEVFARKLRKQVSERVRTSGEFNKYFQAIYLKTLKDYQNFQINYDKETQHGVNKEKQAQYNQIISHELENLNSFKTS